MKQRTIQGTPWNIGFGDRKKEDDPRRHKSRCIHYSKYNANIDKENYCSCFGEHCRGSAHCKRYVDENDMPRLTNGINPKRLVDIDESFIVPIDKQTKIKTQNNSTISQKNKLKKQKKLKVIPSHQTIKSNIAFVFEEDCKNFKTLKKALESILKDKDLESAYFSQKLSLSASETNRLKQILNCDKDIGNLLVACMQKNKKIFSINVKKLCCLINGEEYYSLNYLYTKTINNYFEIQHFIIDLVKNLGVKKLCLNLDSLTITLEQSQQLSAMLNKIFTNQKLEYPLSLLEDIIKQSLSVGKYYTLDFNQSVFKGLIKKYNKEQASSSSNLD